MPDQTPQILPGAIRTASPMLASGIIRLGAEWGLEIGPMTANVIAFVGALAFYVALRWYEVAGKKWASRVLGLGLAAGNQQPTFTPPQPPAGDAQ